MAYRLSSIERARPIVLRDGSTVHVRRVQPRDVAEMLRFLKGLSARSVYLRLCCGGPNLVAVAHELTEVGAHRRGVVAVGARGEIVAHAEYVLISADTAEVAVVVSDSIQRKGLATPLIQCLADDARGNGVERFVAEVLPTNRAMLSVFCRGFGASVIDSDTICEVEFGITAAACDCVAA
jgi:N-acetylglutamate synthase-like GNAT family acetyltransferase